MAVLISLAGLAGAELSVTCVSDAMHETDHRFTVSGYVYSKEGRPLGDARVSLRDLRDQSVEPVSTYTDGTGFYKAILHLHNHNAGDTIKVTATDERLGLEDTKTVRADFDQADLKTERQITVNIGSVPEGLRPPSGVGDWRYIAGGLAVGGALAAVAWSRYRKARAKGKRRAKKRAP